MDEQKSKYLASTPLSSSYAETQGGYQANPVNSMIIQQNNLFPAADTAVPNNEMIALYPEIYKEIYPLVAAIAQKMAEEGFMPTEENIGNIVDNIIKNSGLWFEDEDGAPEDIAVMPVQYSFGKRPYRRHRRGYHNRNTLRDIVKIILFNELINNRGGYHGGYQYPYYY